MHAGYLAQPAISYGPTRLLFVEITGPCWHHGPAATVLIGGGGELGSSGVATSLSPAHLSFRCAFNGLQMHFFAGKFHPGPALGDPIDSVDGEPAAALRRNVCDTHWLALLATSQPPLLRPSQDDERLKALRRLAPKLALVQLHSASFFFGPVLIWILD